MTTVLDESQICSLHCWIQTRGYKIAIMLGKFSTFLNFYFATAEVISVVLNREWFQN